jgi:hypothetical protein
MATMDSGSGHLGARCALHPTLEASGTCERCGNFMCTVCSERGASTFCPTCRGRGERRAFPLRRDTWSFSALWNYCFAAFKREWLMLSLAMLVSMALSMVVGIFGNFVGLLAGAVDSAALVAVSGVLTFLVQTVVQGVMGLGMSRVILDVLEGGRADVGRLFSQIGKAGRYLGAVLLAFVLVGLPLALLFVVLSFVGLLMGGLSVGEIAGGEVFRSRELLVLGVFLGTGLVTLIPGLYFGLPLYLLQAELAFDDDASAVQALRDCYTLARGERLSLLGVSIVAGLVSILGLVACCVGALPTLALGQTLIAGLYLALRTGSEV